MAGAIKHMERSHRSRSKAGNSSVFRGFELRASDKKQEQVVKTSLASKFADLFKRKQSR